MLKIYNTLTKIKDNFTPIDPEHITMYVCGPTVYNFVHIGNARPVVVFDMLYRVLQELYPKVTYARNLTDIDDKIINAAKENNEDIYALTERFAEAFKQDMTGLNTLVPSLVPKATDHIQDMVDMIQLLIDKGHAYEADQHVLFNVRSMKDYGKLSNRSLDDMLAGARVEVATYKQYAGDFVLWKPSSDDQPGWTSPWGRGRPGWHIECSAMINALLGQNIDIHGGGQDLIFPHHENECAQSQCAHGGDYVNYWMHNGYINIDGEKMSKSLGNFKMVRDLLGHFDGEVLRFALLSAHYRSSLNWTEDLLNQAKSSLDSLYGALRDTADIDVSNISINIKGSSVFAALCDDLNTSVAIAELHGLAKALNKAGDADKPQLKAALLTLGNLMGLLLNSADEWFKGGSENTDGLSADDIEAKIAERVAAKKNKEYARSDEIRDELKAAGITLEDTREGTRWTRD